MLAAYHLLCRDPTSWLATLPRDLTEYVIAGLYLSNGPAPHALLDVPDLAKPLRWLSHTVAKEVHDFVHDRYGNTYWVTISPIPYGKVAVTIHRKSAEQSSVVTVLDQPVKLIIRTNGAINWYSETDKSSITVNGLETESETRGWHSCTLDHQQLVLDSKNSDERCRSHLFLTDGTVVTVRADISLQGSEHYLITAECTSRHVLLISTYDLRKSNQLVHSRDVDFPNCDQVRNVFVDREKVVILVENYSRGRLTLVVVMMADLLGPGPVICQRQTLPSYVWSPDNIILDGSILCFRMRVGDEWQWRRLGH